MELSSDRARERETDVIYHDSDSALLFSHFTYVGTDFEGDMRLMRENPTVREWWRVMDQFQEVRRPVELLVAFPGSGTGWEACSKRELIPVQPDRTNRAWSRARRAASPESRPGGNRSKRCSIRRKGPQLQERGRKSA